MKTSVLIIAIIIVTVGVITACAEEGDSLWSRQVGKRGTDAAYAVQVDPSGDYLIAGSSGSYGASNEDAWLLKYTDQGDSLWAHTYGGFYYDAAYAIIPASVGWLLVGYSESFGDWSGNVLMVRTDSAGNQLWLRYFGGKGIDWANAAIETPDGGFLLAGGTTSDGAGGSDLLILKTDSHGDSIWAKTYGGLDDEWATSMIAAPGGGYLIGGMTRSYGSGGEDDWLIKIDQDGNLIWSRTYGGTGNDYCASLTASSDNDLLLAGYTYSYGSGGSDAWLLKLNQAGDSLWSKTYGGSGWENAASVISTGSTIYLSGFCDSFGHGGGDFWLVKCVPSGDSLWAKSYGGNAREAAYAAALNSEGNLLLVGETFSFNADQNDLWMVKVDGITVGIDPEKSQLVPAKIPVSAIYPNPTNSEAKMIVSLPFAAQVNISVYDALGRKITIAVTNSPGSGLYTEGNHTISLDVAGLPSGMYMLKCSIQPQPFYDFSRLTFERRLILVK
ncbi:MAG: T9SS type A sorting domain-containing protein [bacterium]|nr:T9SS type A sorting domain-containing protein [bacterium]